MEEIIVELKEQADRSYRILIRPGLLEESAELLALQFGSQAFAVISDSNLEKLYARPFVDALRGRGLRCEGPIVFPAGEQSKTREVKSRVEDNMFAAGLGRDTVVVALGGGVVGDLAGFVAATYARGVSLVQVPTSLLAMADSSIGGKTGVDVPWGKNLVGAFHQPSLVLIDPGVLRTLTREHFSAGLAEVVKHGVIRDAGLFALLEQNAGKLRPENEELTAALVARNCRIKASVVSADEREGNLRQILNFGHTVGHALETLSGYRWLHGQAVSCGMVVEAQAAALMDLLPPGDLDRLEKILAGLGLPVDLAPLEVRVDQVLELARLDKKARGSRPRYALPAEIGRMAATPEGAYGIPVEEELIARALQARGALG
ncbi:MAG: 3-dehydroquinate synthase [Candidatus Glassbacteria bacterium]|nr:3-dehydroquinate synthase [Candidatus Glassbacteria bacterium]